MDRRSSTPTFSKFFFIFILACLGLIAYGAYTYVQDRNSSNTSTVEEENDTPLTSTIEDSPEIIEGFQKLDEDIERDTKTNLAKEEMESEEPDVSSIPPVMNISFSYYNQSQGIFSIGIIFANNQSLEINNCILEIYIKNSQALNQRTKVVGQNNANGCRFNNISLKTLAPPSQTNPWKITLKGNNLFDNTLATLEKEILSLNDLSNLINN